MAGESEQIIDLVVTAEVAAHTTFGNHSTTLDYLLAAHPWIGTAERLTTPAVLTGSQAYGHPREDSDVDLVIYVPEAALKVLEQLADPDPKWELKTHDYETIKYERFAGRSKPLRFGKLNLICTTDRAIYDAWKLGTEELVRRSAEGPDVVTRDEAKELLHRLRTQVYNGGRATL